MQDSRKYSVAKFDFDEDLPGGGQFYCAETARHFVSRRDGVTGVAATPPHASAAGVLLIQTIATGSQVNAVSLEAHKKTKAYKKRCRELKKTPYSQEEADRAAGLMKEVLPPLRLSRPSALAAAAGDAGGGGAAATMAVE